MRTVNDAEVTSVPGSFWQPDIDLFRHVLAKSAADGPGDLCEIGAFFGRSAVLIGGSVREGETFTVIDLFEAPASAQANAEENAEYYGGLTRTAFEENYTRIHGHLPVVIQGLSSTITEHASAGTHRFVHIDASHLYEHVVDDVNSARVLLRTDGVVVFDDYRSVHTPGVGAAAWGAVATTGLRPFAVSPHKLYATWGDAPMWHERMMEWARTSGQDVVVEEIAGVPVVRFPYAPAPRPHHFKRYVPEVLWGAMAKVRSVAGRSG